MAPEKKPTKPPFDFASLGKYPEAQQRALEWLKSPPEPLAPLIPPKTETGGGTTTTKYSLGYWFVVETLYPTLRSLPPEYHSFYPDVLQTIRGFTLQSAIRDGFKDATVTVERTIGELSSQYVVTISAKNPAIAGYATVHPAFLNRAHGAQSAIGARACQACSSCATCGLCTTSTDPMCWDPAPKANNPWAMYLPLGLPMLNQKTVLFLDYPPIPALTGKNSSGSSGDYLNNFTICRWSRVLDAAGADDPLAYETILDSRPIAAPGTGQSQHLPIPTAAYNNATTGGLFINPMLQLLTNPLGTMATGTLPIAVFGSVARQTWGQILGTATPGVLAVGTTNLGGQPQKTGWIATNHPDVTTYNCCGSDTYCNATSRSLIPDEQIDFVTACWLQAMAADPTLDPATAKTQCAAKWQPPTAGANALTECIQEKLDNNNQKAVCCSWQDAWAYCTDHANNACSSLDCSFKASTRAKAPPTPVWQENTCNTFRFFPGSAYCARCGCPTTAVAKVFAHMPDGPPAADAEADAISSGTSTPAAPLSAAPAAAPSATPTPASAPKK